MTSLKNSYLFLFFIYQFLLNYDCPLVIVNNVIKLLEHICQIRDVCCQIDKFLFKHLDLLKLFCSFIRAAFLALSPEAPQTKQFIPKILRELLKQLTSFMQGNPPLKQMTEARLLKMAVESMLRQFE